MMELEEHPFIQTVPDKDFHVSIRITINSNEVNVQNIQLLTILLTFRCQQNLKN